MAGFTNPGSNNSFANRLASNLQDQVAPIFSLKPTAKYHTGARCVLRINGQLVGFAFSVGWRINTVQEEIYTIDDYLPYELAPQRVTVDGTLGMFHIPGKGPSAEYIQSNVLSFMTHRYISIEVRDSATNQLLFYTSKAAVTSRVEDIKVEQMGTMHLSWKAIGWQDEQKPALQEAATTGDSGINDDIQNSLGSSIFEDNPGTILESPIPVLTTTTTVG